LTDKVSGGNGYGDCTFQFSRYGFMENGDEFGEKIARFREELRIVNKD
jgi:hypothetical protein